MFIRGTTFFHIRKNITWIWTGLRLGEEQPDAAKRQGAQKDHEAGMTVWAFLKQQETHFCFGSCAFVWMFWICTLFSGSSSLFSMPSMCFRLFWKKHQNRQLHFPTPTAAFAGTQGSAGGPWRSSTSALLRCPCNVNGKGRRLRGFEEDVHTGATDFRFGGLWRCSGMHW